jgi:abortive infection bacteriophage resistance protein
MKYVKQPLSIQQQIERLKYRGLIIDDENLAANTLSTISYYRLRAYTYPFQCNDDEKEHRFIRNDIHFNDILDLYCFDSRLRLLIFNAIEKIEIAIRTIIVHEYAMQTKNSHWYINASLFKNESYFTKLYDDICSEINRSSEDFIKHYRNTYSAPELPPAWMTLEVLSFGILSRIYELLKKTELKEAVTKWFGLTNISIMENWFHSISVLRNCCAHHNRIWNRRFSVGVKLPYNTLHPFMDRETIKSIHNNKLFSHLSCIKYILDIVSPENDFKKNLIETINNGGNLLKIKDMGFPDNWRYLDVWKEKIVPNGSRREHI